MSAEKFHFTQGGKKYTIPRFDQMPAGALRRSRAGANDMEKAFIILEEALGADSKELAAIDRMPLPEFNQFLQDWTGQKGDQVVPLGESSDS